MPYPRRLSNQLGECIEVGYLPATLGVLGLFAGRQAAIARGQCPHRGKVWGAFILPLLLLPLMMQQSPLILLVSVGAALGAGLTAHSSMKVSLVATFVGVVAGTLVNSQLFPGSRRIPGLFPATVASPGKDPRETPSAVSRKRPLKNVRNLWSRQSAKAPFRNTSTDSGDAQYPASPRS